MSDAGPPPETPKASWWVLVVPFALLVLVVWLIETFGVIPD